MPTCASCSREIDFEDKIFRTDVCPQCGRDLHTCTNCAHFEPGRHNDCREERADWVSDRESSNFCDYFRFGARPPAVDPVAAAKARLDAMFRK